MSNFFKQFDGTNETTFTKEHTSLFKKNKTAITNEMFWAYAYLLLLVWVQYSLGNKYTDDVILILENQLFDKIKRLTTSEKTFRKYNGIITWEKQHFYRDYYIYRKIPPNEEIDIDHLINFSGCSQDNHLMYMAVQLYNRVLYAGGLDSNFRKSADMVSLWIIIVNGFTYGCKFFKKA